MNIHLGYEMGSGEAVSVPLHHACITGLTQMSGKTTACHALLSRLPEGFAGLEFRTKRGELSFVGARPVQPFFKTPLENGRLLGQNLSVSGGLYEAYSTEVKILVRDKWAYPDPGKRGFKHRLELRVKEKMAAWAPTGDALKAVMQNIMAELARALGVQGNN
jgi:hypothetical protein